MTARKPESLAKPAVIAYLIEHVEQLSKDGVFKPKPVARTVFLHLCFHHGAPALPGRDREPTWTCPVAEPNHKPAVIAAATGLNPRDAARGLGWLASEDLIHQERGSKTRKSYGPVTILSTNRSTELKRTSPYNRRKRKERHHVAMDPIWPADGHHVANNDTMSLNDRPTAPGQPRRTVAAGRRPA